MAQPGILSWATSIRATMVNDPCRQSFEDQIQTHGFLFLDDYLDNILARAKRDPLIDLVKTPGRKKDAPKRTRAAIAAAKAKSAITLSLEDNDTGKENQAPLNSFHQALLQAKDNSKGEPKDDGLLRPSRGTLGDKISVNPSEQEKPRAVVIVEDVEEVQEDEQVVEQILSSSPPPSPAPMQEMTEPMDLLVPPHVDQANDLSIIAEDDESMERLPSTSNNMIGTSHNEPKVRNVTASPTIPPPPIDAEEDETIESTNVTNTSSQTFHTVPLDSPGTGPNSNLEYLTAPLPQMPQSHSGPIYDSEKEAMTAPLPSSSSAPDLSGAPLKDAPAQFPSLPAPSPLRKSMRVQREPSFGMGTGSMPTVGAGKRTSWLAKAKEVRAMEIPGKRVSTLGNTAAVPLPAHGPSGVKRKSGEMLATTVPGMAGMMAHEEEERKRKIAKTSDSDIVQLKEKSKNGGKSKAKERDPIVSQREPTPPPVAIESQSTQVVFPTTDDQTVLIPIQDPQEGMIDRFKRTVEGLGSRVGKSVSMSKSLGGPAAAAALAEARAAKVAAEARIAERDGRGTLPSPVRNDPVAVERATFHVVTSADKESIAPVPPPKDRQRKLSVSDLVTAYEGSGKGNPKDKSKETEKGFKPIRASASSKNHVGDESTSTTPPDSPPPIRNSTSSFVLPSGPVFNKPPVFVPPAPVVPPKDFSFKMPATTFTLPPASSIGLPARLPSPSSQKNAPPLSAQSTIASVFSDNIFDTQDDIPAWMPSTQETEYSVALGSEAQLSQKIDDLDEDDSWPMVDEKLSAANPSWTPFGFTTKEDSMTWSTLPTESQRDTRSMHAGTNQEEQRDEDMSKHIPDTSDMDIDGRHDGELQESDLDLGESELEDLGLAAGKSTVSLVKSKAPERSQSQMSMVSLASTSSSQSQIGWVGHATKLVSSVLGGSKNKKPQVPSLQRAAAAAKKEQEEKDKKATRMKEMENRRQLAIQRKAEEEKSKAVEEEKKIKEDGERRKREREETTDKRPLKAGLKKVDEDTAKKRKITVEVDKKPVESKKPPSKDKKDNVPSRVPQPATASTTTKPNHLNKSGTGFKPSGSTQALSSSATYNTQIATTTVKLAETKVVKASTASKVPSIKGKSKAPVQDDDLSQPSHQLQTQMAARAKAQLQAAKQHLPESTENIELPDIHSEYSDSDDEDRPRTFDPPDWAQSPELRQQLQMQSTVNPDDIFGPIRPLRMEEVFRTRQSRFRARTSSANWTGTDRLTIEEERDYARRMGFR